MSRLLWKRFCHIVYVSYDIKYDVILYIGLSFFAERWWVICFELGWVVVPRYLARVGVKKPNYCCVGYVALENRRERFDLFGIISSSPVPHRGVCYHTS